MRKNIYTLFSMLLLLLLPVFSYQLQLTNDLTANDKPKHPEEAIRFRMMQRADENGFIPMDGLVKAKEKIESMQTDDAGLWNWEWLGPGNIGGRIRAILIHPTSTSTIWIGGVAGGIFKSTNGGSSWSVVDDFMANLAITSLVMDPNNSSIMYASTGEGFGNADGLPGAGIFKSTNGGVTWAQLESTNNTIFRWVNRLEHHPDSSGVLYAVITAPNSVWKTNDGGNSLTKISDWVDYHNGGSANSAHADHHIIVNHPSYNGSTNKKVYFGNDGGIQMTNDVTTVSQNSGWINLAGTTLGITQFYGGAATTSGNLIVGGTQDNDKVHYTPAGGTGGWTQPHTGDGGFAAINWVNPLYVYGEYVYLSIRRSTNGGSSYVERVNGLGDANSSTKALFIAPFVMDPSDYTRLIAGGSRIWETTDNAANWSEIKSNVGTYLSGGTLYFISDAAPST